MLSILVYAQDVILVTWGAPIIITTLDASDTLAVIKIQVYLSTSLTTRECKESYNKDSFKILGNARTRYELALKEGMQIKWRKPSLNILKKHEILKLLV